MPIGAEVLPTLPRAEKFPEMPDAHVYFELAELTRRITRELEDTNPETRRAIVLAQSLRHIERAALALRSIAGLDAVADDGLKQETPLCRG
jgi:hypothetical protein